MVSKRPFQVKEITTGTGSACGAMYLDENFEKLLYDRLGSKAGEILTIKCLTEAVKNFEEDLKQTFDPFAPDCDSEFEVPLPGAEDNPSLGISAGYITLSK